MIVHIFKHQRKAKLFLWLLFTFKPKSQKSVKSSTVWRFCNVAIWIVPVSERNSHLTVYTFHIFLVMHQTPAYPQLSIRLCELHISIHQNLQSNLIPSDCDLWDVIRQIPPEQDVGWMADDHENRIRFDQFLGR